MAAATGEIDQQGTGRSWTVTLLFLLTLSLLAALFFWRLWAPNPADRVTFPIGDFTDQYYPLRAFVARSLATGHLPFWNPFIYAGQPGLADPQAGALYPPAALNGWFWGGGFPLAALQAEVVAHIVLAGLGTALFIVRALRLSFLPALTGAVIFAFGGYLTGFPLEQITILETVAWLPWWLLTLHLAGSGRERPVLSRLAWGAVGAVVGALVLLAGHPQSALYLMYIGLTYALFLVVQGRGSGLPLVVRALPLLIPFLLAAGLAAAQLLPTASFISLSSRQSLDYSFVRGGLAWQELTTLILPKVVGATPLYHGILPLLLAPLGLISAGRRAEKQFWGGAALLSLLLSFGGGGALFDLLYLGLPGLARVRSQERVLVLWAWALALLAAWGVAAIQEQSSLPLRRYSRWLALFVPVLVLPLIVFWWLLGLVFSQVSVNLVVYTAFFDGYSLFLLLFVLGWALLAWRAIRRPRGWGWLVVALLLFDLFSINRATHIGPPPGEALTPATPLVDELHLRQAERPGRIGVVGTTVPRTNDGMRYGLPLLSGNEPLRLAVVERFFAQAPPWPQLLLTQARYVLADRDLAAETPEAYEALGEDNGTYLLALRPDLPYAWTVRSVDRVSGDALFDRLAAPDFDPFQRALLDFDLPIGEGAAVTVRARRAGYAALDVENGGREPVLLLVAEPAVEGWRAEVDGSEVAWLRANGFNLALYVPPGVHRVTLRYVQPGWSAGLAVSGVSALALLALLLGGLVSWWRRR